MAFIISAHTTAGIVVNAGLECVETDILETLGRFIPGDAPYVHAHFLHSYGAIVSHAPGHLKSLLTGNHCVFPVADGRIQCGSAQDIHLVEFDRPQSRTVYVQTLGE